jgi:hypothetical protein
MTDAATGSLQAGASYLHPYPALLQRRRARGRGPRPGTAPASCPSGTATQVEPRVLASDAAALGAVCVDGRMVDRPVAERARRIIRAQQ